MLSKGNNEFIGRPVLEIISSKDQLVFLDLIKATAEENKEQKWKILRVIAKDRAEKPFLVNITQAHQKHGLSEGFKFIGLPIANGELEEDSFSQFVKNQTSRITVNKYESIFNNATIGIAVLDENGYCSGSQQRFL
jgi:hypothetical protein